jgi:hypothetical protein
MADVFISYSRRDSEFVTRLSAALQDRGKDVWVDTEGIRDAEVFPAASNAVSDSPLRSAFRTASSHSPAVARASTEAAMSIAGE